MKLIEQLVLDYAVTTLSLACVTIIVMLALILRWVK